MKKEVHYAFCLSQESEYIKDTIKKYNHDKYIQYTFWANEILSQEFWNSISSNSLLSKPKLLILRNSHKLSKEEYLLIEESVLINNDIFILFAIEQENIPSYIEQSVLFRHAKESRRVHKQELITRKNIIQYIEKYCKDKGFSLETKALIFLKDIIPCNLSAIQSECDKFILSSMNNTITLDIVKQTISYTLEHSIWHCLEQIVKGENILLVWNSLTENHSFFTVSAILQRELRLLGALLCEEEISLPHYIVEKKQVLSKKIQLKGITALFNTLSSMEYNIKIGNITEQEALEYTLCTLPYIIYNNKIDTINK